MNDNNTNLDNNLENKKENKPKSNIHIYIIIILVVALIIFTLSVIVNGMPSIFSKKGNPYIDFILDPDRQAEADFAKVIPPGYISIEYIDSTDCYVTPAFFDGASFKTKKLDRDVCEMRNYIIHYPNNEDHVASYEYYVHAANPNVVRGDWISHNRDRYRVVEGNFKDKIDYESYRVCEDTNVYEPEEKYCNSLVIFMKDNFIDYIKKDNYRVLKDTIYELYCVNNYNIFDFVFKDGYILRTNGGGKILYFIHDRETIIEDKLSGKFTSETENDSFNEFFEKINKYFE